MNRNAVLVAGLVLVLANTAGCGRPADRVLEQASDEMVLGLATVIYHVSDLDVAKEWYTQVFGVQPYFDEPFYVGFNIGGYELGLNPDPEVSRPGPGGTVAYWRVQNIEEAVERFTVAGATVKTAVQDVGGGIKTADLADPDGNLLGLIENPHFSLPN